MILIFIMSSSERTYDNLTILRKALLILIILFLNCIGFILYSQPDTSSLNHQLVISRLAQPVNFDGIPDEEAWNSVSPVKLTMYQPVFGKEPSEETDVRIGYDNKFLYVGGRMYFKDPGMIRSASFKRDYMGMGSDWLGIILDTYDDKENALAFFTTPDALRWDASILKDAVTSMPDQMPLNISWNTFWDVIAKKDQSGWTAEIRIPLSSLRFQQKDGAVKMGLIAFRYLPAKNEINIFPSIPPNWGQSSFLKPSQAKEVLFKGLKPDKPIYIAPYALAGYLSTYDLNSSGTDYSQTGKPVFEAGGDIKYGLSENMVLDLTINTDFAQVEADDEQINLTRYSLYHPEKRPFFLERSSIFDFNLGSNNTLFYSRRIGLSDDGDPIRIYGGARLIGRVGKWDLAFLDMQTAPLRKKNSAGGYEEILPSENFGVLRFRRQVINENSYIGAGFTSRLGVNGNYNIGYGIDGIFRLFGQDYLDMKLAQTFETGVTATSFLKPARISLDWTRRSTNGLGYTIGYSYSGLNFNPGIGFEMLNDFYSAKINILYGWIPGESSKLYSHNIELRTRYSEYLVDGSMMTYSSNLNWEFVTKNQWQGMASVVYNRENLKDSLILVEDEAYVLPGEYEFVNFMGMVSTPGSRPFFVMLSTEGGQYYDGWRVSLHLQPTWNISKHFELGGTYGIDHVKFADRKMVMTNHILGVKALYMLNTKLSVNAFIQYNTAEHAIVSNLRLRYNPKEGNDFYLVFNEGRNTSLTRKEPNLPVYSSLAVMVKYTYTFSL
jgi:hypothetical protein